MLWRPALHAAQPGKSAKCLVIEPVLPSLCAEMCDEKVDLALQNLGRQRDIEIGLTEVAIPFGNLIFENDVVAKRRPGMAADLPVVLMQVVAAVGENEIRVCPGLEGFRTRA